MQNFLPVYSCLAKNYLILFPSLGNFTTHIALLKMLCVNKLPGQGRRLQSHLCKLSRLKVFENFGGKYRLKLLKFLARSENSKNINKAGKCCV